MEIDGQKVACLIEVRGIYDGWGVAKLVDGTLHNRWPPDDRRHKPTQDWIVSYLNQQAEIGRREGGE